MSEPREDPQEFLSRLAAEPFEKYTLSVVLLDGTVAISTFWSDNAVEVLDNPIGVFVHDASRTTLYPWHQVKRAWIDELQDEE